MEESLDSWSKIAMLFIMKLINLSVDSQLGINHKWTVFERDIYQISHLIQLLT